MSLPPCQLRTFKNTYPDYNFQSIYDTIKAHFPIDDPEKYTEENIQSFPGLEKIAKAMNDNFVDAKQYRQWSALNKLLKKEMKKKVESTFSLFNFCYSGAVVLEEIKNANFIKSKKLHFYISVLGPYFSICGIDSSTVMMPWDSSIENFPFEATHAVTISPAFEYETAFRSLEDKIRQRFPGYSFVPYDIGMCTLKGISFENDHSRDPRMTNTIYEGLYGQLAVHTAMPRGDGRYGFADWTRPWTKTEQVLANELSNHLTQSVEETTAHRVWKLTGHKRLDNSGKLRHVMFGSDMLPDLLDLCHPSKAIVWSAGGRAPHEVSYRLTDDLIQLSSTFRLRIINITKSTLIANLALDIRHESLSVNGEFLELKFVDASGVVDPKNLKR
ncbi:hypothetical protein [Chryseolinea lacunae]|uniref:Uncharacterized protein n=1 Tax=Chryseolinea lacunae TaxID=2801331 RepID=A0ABS1KXG1_9BACT|nr:hypothetical protein [Chryseolinea lacunae]MBL0743893.1 hypothetical protein [Chryseolinea lacunae]